MDAVVAAIASAFVTGLFSLILFLLNSRKRETEIRHLNAEIRHLNVERKLIEGKLKAFKQKSCVFDEVAKLRNFIAVIAELLGYYTYFEWLQWHGWDTSEGASQHFLSHHRKRVEELVLNVGLGFVESSGKLFSMGDLLFAALNITFWNEIVDPLLRKNPKNLRDELENAYKRAFIQSIEKPVDTVLNSGKGELRRRYKYDT